MKKKIPGYEDYSLTESGQLYHGEREITRRDPWQGYPRVSLTVDGKKKNRKLHRLIAQTFVKNPKNLTEVLHKDNDRSNINASNLAWGDRISNAKDRLDRGSYKYKTRLYKGRSFLDKGDHFFLPERGVKAQIGNGNKFSYDNGVHYIDVGKIHGRKFKDFSEQWKFIEKNASCLYTAMRNKYV